MGVAASKRGSKPAEEAKRAEDDDMAVMECKFDAKKSDSPEDAWKRLEEGNARFAEWREKELFYGIATHANPEFRSTLLGGQQPFACVVTCADSRVDPLLTFGCGLGQIFTIKNAGNMAGYNTIASVEYAVEHLNVPIVVFLGHEFCGAVSVTIDRVVSTPEEASPAAEGEDYSESKISLEPLRIRVKHRSSGSASDLAKEILHARTRGKAQLSKLTKSVPAPIKETAEPASGSLGDAGLATPTPSVEGSSGAAVGGGGGAELQRLDTPPVVGVAAAVSRAEKVSEGGEIKHGESTHSRFLDNLVEGIKPAVKAVQQMTKEQGLPACTCHKAKEGGAGAATEVEKPADFVRMCVEQNAILQCQETLALSAGVRKAVKERRCLVVPAYYSLTTGTVTRLELPDKYHGYRVEA